MKSKFISPYILVFLFIFSFSKLSYSQDSNVAKADTTVILTKQEKKAEKKALNKEALKGRHFEITSFVTFGSMNSGISITGPKGVLGANISLENFLGFEKNVVLPSFVFSYAFTRRSSIYAEYYNIHRSVKYEVNNEFEFGDTIVPTDIGTIKIYFNTDIWSMGYRYSLINSDKADLSFFFNIYAIRVGTGINADNNKIFKNYSFVAPLPSFGYQFSYEMAKNFYFGASMSLFILEISDFSGFFNNSRITFDYKTTKWLNLGLGFNYFKLKINTTEPEFKTDIDYGYNGPTLFAKFTF